jgi:hypothetical protein
MLLARGAENTREKKLSENVMSADQKVFASIAERSLLFRERMIAVAGQPT